MLETMWESRRQDLLDLISPFIIYAVAKVTSPGEVVADEKALEIVKNEFGYSDMPLTIVRRVLRRQKKFFRKENGEYILKSNLDSYVQDIEKRRDDCEKKIEVLGQELESYLEEHIQSKKLGRKRQSYRKNTLDQAISDLQGFFTRNGIFLGTNQLVEHIDEFGSVETDYYIAQFLYKKKDEGAKEYGYVLDLVKGYFLQSAIYLQADNGSITSATYKNVAFYYDTPFLLRLLGFKTEEDEKSAVELHNSLKLQKGKFYYFPQTQSEIEGILWAYEKNIGHTSAITLERFDEKHYQSSAVDRVRRTWERKLNSYFDTKRAPVPEYHKDSNGKIDSKFVIDDNDLKNNLKEHIKWRSDEAMNADIDSVVGINKLREGAQSEEIEHCKAVFVTTNDTLARAVNEYYRDNINDTSFPLLITDSDLAALTWIKCGTKSDLPERQLLRNAYMATQPAPELFEKFGKILDQMQEEGTIDSDLAIIIRSSGYAKKELLFSSFDGLTDEDIDEDYVSRITEKLRADFSKDARDDERQKAVDREKEQQHKLLENADKSARDFAEKKKNNLLKWCRRIISIFTIIISIITLVGLILSLVGSFSKNLISITALAAFMILSAVSAIDTIKGKGKAIDKLLIRLANRKYDKVYKAKRAEYIPLAAGNDANVHG